jgi:hypothetical protein
MAIKDSTIKRLFGMSRNECAMPDCKSPLIIGDVVVGEICHIRARRKKGPRYDPSVTAMEKDELGNLLLLCGTCHKLIDSSLGDYRIDWLETIKSAHEARTPLPVEISQKDAANAMLLLGRHINRSIKKAGDVEIRGSVQASATRGGVAVAIGGTNQGHVSIKIPASKDVRGYPPNSIGADANMTNYIEYLCDLYLKFMRPIEPNEDKSWAKLGKHIKTKFHLKKRTRNHLSAERFWDLVNFLIDEKLAFTPVGRKHLRQGMRLCRTFDEFRHGKM